MRYLGLDVHRDFCEVAICERGRARSVGRIDTTREALELFASSLAADDRVVLESTGNALAIAGVLRRHVANVVLANPTQVRAISHAKVKNDRVDARTLAELLAADLLPQVWIADEPTRALRRLTSRRTQLIRQRTRTKNEVCAVLVRNLIARPDVSDLFGKAGRQWMATLELPADERHTLDGCLRQIDFLSDELAVIDGAIAGHVLASGDMRRLLTIPGVDATTAATMMATIGRIHRFPTPRHLVGYVGLDARVRQSGNHAARHGRISKQGASAARHVLVQAAWAAIKTPGPLHAFYRRVKARRGAQISIVAVARKLAILSRHLSSSNRTTPTSARNWSRASSADSSSRPAPPHDADEQPRARTPTRTTSNAPATPKPATPTSPPTGRRTRSGLDFHA
jgi:transposase